MILRGYDWREIPGSLIVEGVDLGSGPIAVGNEGNDMIVAMVVEDPVQQPVVVKTSKNHCLFMLMSLNL